jgi:hypothetical protein
MNGPAAVGLHPNRAMMQRRWWFGAALLFAVVLPSNRFPADHAVLLAGQGADAARDPYRITAICTPLIASDRPPVSVSNGAELQQALDRAVGGDTILLAAGATFLPSAPEGSFMLRNRRIPAGQWITIRSAHSAFDASGALPPATRVDKSNQDLMPRIRATATNLAAIRVEARARGYRLIGLDIGVQPGVTQLANLVDIGSDRDTTVDAKPSDIVIDRCYLHGNDAGNYRRGVALNGIRLSVVDSYFENFHDANSDSQAIAGWSGPGPFKIVNNFLEAASENIMFGGSDPSIAQLVPSDIEIRGNFLTKRLSWRTSGVPVKNAFELKNARRVLVEGNIFEHVWSSGQDGTAIVLKSTNQEGACTWCVTEFVTFRNNIVRGAAHGLLINAAEAGARGLPLPQRVNHIRIQNVLFTDIGGERWGGGKLFRVFGGVSNLEITHVTSTGNATGILDPRNPSDLNPNLVFKYNIVERRYYGIGAGGDEGITTVTRNFAPYVYNQNVLVNTSRATDQAIGDDALKSRYPPVTTIARDWNAVGFVNGTQRLAATSPYYRAGDDGKDLGADVDEVMAAVEGAGGGGCSTRPETPAGPPRRAK